MGSALEVDIVPYAGNVAGEAAHLIDAAAALVASVFEPAAKPEPSAFRDAVVGAALEHGGVAGVLFADRWGGGGVMLT